MPDFTLPAPGATSNPWTPAKTVIFGNGLSTTTAGGIHGHSNAGATSFGYSINCMVGGVATIVTQFTMGAVNPGGDDWFIGALVGGGANGGALIGLYIQTVGCIAATMSPTFVKTNVGSSQTAQTNVATDVWVVTVSVAAGTATISATKNGTAVTLTGPNTTTTYATETTLCPGGGLVCGNTNNTFISLFTGTGMAGTNPVFALGQTGAGYVTPATGTDLANSGGAMSFSAGYVAAYTGPVSMIYIYTPSGGTGSTFTVNVYNGNSVAAGALVATSSIGTKQGNTLIGVPISGFSQVSGQTYTLQFSVVSGFLLTQFDSSAPSTGVIAQWTAAAIPNPSPPSTLPSPSSSAGHEFTVWGEGLPSGGGGSTAYVVVGQPGIWAWGGGSAQFNASVSTVVAGGTGAWHWQGFAAVISKNGIPFNSGGGYGTGRRRFHRFT